MRQLCDISGNWQQQPVHATDRQTGRQADKQQRPEQKSICHFVDCAYDALAACRLQFECAQNSAFSFLADLATAFTHFN